MRAESMATHASGAPDGWTSQIVLLTARQDGPLDWDVQAPPGVRLNWFTDPAAMLLAVGSDPPSLVILDSRVVGVDVGDLTWILSSRADTAVCVGVWPDDASKRVAYKALERGARGLLPMPVTGTALHGALTSLGGVRAARLTRIQLGSLVMIEESRDVRIRGIKVNLAESQFGLLRCLVRAHPKPVPFERLRLGCTFCDGYRAKGLGATVGRLRRRLDEAVPGAAAIVGTVRGAGYVAKEFH